MIDDGQPAAVRAAAGYVGAVVAVAAVAFAVYVLLVKDSVLSASTVPLILFVGGLGAFVKTYREWKVSGGWVAWQGAGWFLLVAMLFCLSIPGAALFAG